MLAAMLTGNHLNLGTSHVSFIAGTAPPVGLHIEDVSDFPKVIKYQGLPEGRTRRCALPV